MGHMQSKCRPKGVMLTLHETHCVHSSMNVKIKFISFLTLLFYIVLVHYFSSFTVNLVEYAAKKSYKPTCLLIRLKSGLHDVT